MSVTIHQGDALEVLRTMPDESVHCCVTSPPYWGLRDYGVDGQIGLEPTPQDWVDRLVEVFREVRRVLRSDGTCWVNLGDCYAGQPNGGQGKNGALATRSCAKDGIRVGRGAGIPSGLKPKDLVGQPWRFAFAAQADGWWLRQDIVWHKPNPMPESVTDRCTKAHEYLFFLTKSERYWWDQEAIREPHVEPERSRLRTDYMESHGTKDRAGTAKMFAMTRHREYNQAGRNRRSVWTVPTAPYSEAHFATYPPDLIKPCILAGCPVGGTVLDPFGGSGTTGMVALELGRKAVLIELNPEYVKLIEQRTHVTHGLALT